MARKADEGWVSRNGKPVPIPPYKPPRQKTAKGKYETTVSERVIEVLDSEDKGNGVIESDSEEETQFGLVWGSPGIPETELQDSDVEEDNIPFSELREKRKADKQQTIVLITETEDQDSELVVIDEVTFSNSDKDDSDKDDSDRGNNNRNGYTACESRKAF